MGLAAAGGFFALIYFAVIIALFVYVFMFLSQAIRYMKSKLEIDHEMLNKMHRLIQTLEHKEKNS